MIRPRFDPEWESFRAAARPLLLANIPPDRIFWGAEGEGEGGSSAGLFGDGSPSRPSPTRGALHVPRRLMEAGEAVACHRDPGRWALLYRLLWRIGRGERQLLEIEVDPDVDRLIAMERAVRRASHKMKAFVRFRATGSDEDPYVAWFEPEHRVTERVAPFFARRFTAMKWSILTPDRCAHWGGHSLTFSPGVHRSSAPSADALEELWRTYYANIFNPARLNGRMMQSEMPKMYWKNLPEADLIAKLQREAHQRQRGMVEQRSSPLTEPALRPNHASRSAEGVAETAESRST
jgi:uracil-DNA glycosylase